MLRMHRVSELVNLGTVGLLILHSVVRKRWSITCIWVSIFVRKVKIVELVDITKVL